MPFKASQSQAVVIQIQTGDGLPQATSFVQGRIKNIQPTTFDFLIFVVTKQGTGDPVLLVGSTIVIMYSSAFTPDPYSDWELGLHYTTKWMLSEWKTI